MGWTCTRLSSHDTKLDYINRNTGTWDNERSTAKVLKSTMVGAVYYGAVEVIKKADGERIVFALVVLTQSHPRAEDGLNFCFKELDETAGPYQVDCPVGILNLLTETTSPSALEWRARCAERRKAKENEQKSKPKQGDRFRLEKPLNFPGGKTLRDFMVCAIKYRGRNRTVYKSLEDGQLYRIGDIAKHSYEPLNITSDTGQLL